MKTSGLVIVLLASVAAAHGQSLGAAALPATTAYAVVDQGANYRVWQKTTVENGASRIHRYVELASGLNVQDPTTGQWKPSGETIEVYPGGAIARQGPYQVIFANNLNSAGAIDQQTPDGKRLVSNILGLAYYDSSIGSNVLFATVQNSQGELFPPIRCSTPTPSRA